jgi:hypothetical protein
VLNLDLLLGLKETHQTGLKFNKMRIEELKEKGLLLFDVK